MTIRKRPVWVWVTAIIAVVFGAMTIKSGGSVLFINGEARLAAGNYVDFVLWFNFIAGFFYIATGFGFWLKKSWAPMLAITIASLTILVFAAFGIHVFYANFNHDASYVLKYIHISIFITIAGILIGVSRHRASGIREYVRFEQKKFLGLILYRKCHKTRKFKP